MKRKYLIPLNLQLFSEEPPKDDDDKSKGDPSKQDDKTVPYDRFKSVNDALGAYKTFGSAEDLAAKLERLAALEKDDEERKKAQMTELERLQAAKEAEERRAKDAEERAAKIEAERLNDKIEHAIEKEAADAVDLEAVLAFVDRSALKVEDGKVVGVKEAVEALKAAKPYLFQAPEQKKPKKIGDENNPANQKGEKTKEQLLEDARIKAMTSGRQEDRVAYAELKLKLK